MKKTSCDCAQGHPAGACQNFKSSSLPTAKPRLLTPMLLCLHEPCKQL